MEIQARGNFDNLSCNFGPADVMNMELVDHLAVVNRVTPLSYPATLTDVRLATNRRAGQPFRLLVYADPGGAGDGPSGIPAVQAIRNLGPLLLIVDTYHLDQPITIQTGDFYVGIFFEGAHNGRGPLLYTSIPQHVSTFISRDGMASWQRLALRDASGKPIPATAEVGALLTGNP